VHVVLLFTVLSEVQPLHSWCRTEVQSMNLPSADYKFSFLVPKGVEKFLLAIVCTPWNISFEYFVEDWGSRVRISV
jgi:hypothetical protein